MATTERRRGQRLLVQGVATAITALLIAGGAAFAAGAPSEVPTDAPDAGAAQSQAGQEAAPDAKPDKAAKADKPAKAKAAKAKGPKAAKAGKAAKARGPKAASGQGRALGRGNGKGNGHGKAVSAAARGETPPVGNCRNHGHWVSTVAKGLASCDDNRPAVDD
jgi:hypothetical protein